MSRPSLRVLAVVVLLLAIIAGGGYAVLRPTAIIDERVLERQIRHLALPRFTMDAGAEDHPTDAAERGLVDGAGTPRSSHPFGDEPTATSETGSGLDLASTRFSSIDELSPPVSTTPVAASSPSTSTTSTSTSTTSTTTPTEPTSTTAKPIVAVAPVIVKKPAPPTPTPVTTAVRPVPAPRPPAPASPPPTTVPVTTTPTTAPSTTTVPPANGAPTARDDRVETTLFDSIRIDMLSNDSDPDGDKLTVTVPKLSSHMATLRVSRNQRRIFYTPDPSAYPFAGEDRFEYTITDPDGRSSTATVFVDVQPGFVRWSGPDRHDPNELSSISRGDALYLSFFPRLSSHQQSVRFRVDKRWIRTELEPFYDLGGSTHPDISGRVWAYSTASLALGDHNLLARTLDDNGHTSDDYKQTFNVVR